MRMCRQLEFINKDAKQTVTTVFVATESIPQVMQWYGAFCAGDNYYVLCDGLKLKIDCNGHITGELP